MKKDLFVLLICGSRDFDDYSQLKSVVDKLISKKLKTHTVVVLSGGAKGADTLGEKYADENCLSKIIVPANWDKHGTAAGPIRNRIMSELAHAAVCFWDGSSKGTSGMIDLLNDKNIPNRVVIASK